MKQSIYLLTVVLLSSSLLAGCKKEAKLTPTTTPEDVYGDSTLPQGNHPYDADILQLFKKYNTLFLYKYKPHDLYYNVTDYIGGTYDTASDQTTKPGYFDVPADEAYVGVQLDLLKELWLNYYPDSLLKKGLPQKVYLVDSFYLAYSGPGKPLDNYPTFLEAFKGGDYILATWGSARITNIALADKYALKSQLNADFLDLAHAQGAVTRSPAFTALTDYSAVNYYTADALGVIDYYNHGTPDTDWDLYMETIVSNSYATLTSPGNILSPDRDTNGIFLKKYNIMIAYFQSVFGVDLQAIGNADSQ